MKTLRFLLLLGVGAVVAAVISDYIDTRDANLRVRVVEPDTIPSNLNTQSGRWSWSQSSGSERAIEITAGGLRQSNESSVLDLKDVELKILHESRGTYDLVETPAGVFDTSKERLYSDDEVTITLGIPNGADPRTSAPTRIRTSGVTFESKTGVCATERYAEYEFNGGRGHSTGAYYDPAQRFFRMESGVFLERFGQNGHPAAQVRADGLVYYEDAQRIEFEGNVVVERGPETLKATRATVQLEEGLARRIEASETEGLTRQEARTVQYSSRQLDVMLNEAQALQKVSAIGAAKLESRSATSRIEAWGDRIDLDYEPRPESTESLLRMVHLRDQARVEEHPAATRGGGMRRLQADWIELRMAENGSDLQALSTLTRGRLDLEPQTGVGKKEAVRRRLEADRIQGLYGQGNHIEQLNATGNVEVESSSIDDSGAAAPPLRTWSEHFEGSFDPETGQAQQMKQWADFRFQRGDREGRAGEALFQTASNEVELSVAAEVWDPTGTVRADRILLDENTGDYTARGGASSSFTEGRTEKSSEKDSGGLFAAGQPVFATAEEIASVGKTGLLTLGGEARLWQEQDRLEADRIQIDRASKILKADGHVVNYLTEQASASSGSRARPGSGLVRISSSSLDYNEQNKLMVYVGSAELRRTDLTVSSDRLEGYLSADNEAGTQGRLKKAFAAGNVRIVENKSSAPRQGTGQEGEYYPNQSKVILTGEPAVVQDGSRGRTEGTQLTYYLDDDRLLVQGSEAEPARTLRRKGP